MAFLKILSYFCCINNLKTTKQEHYNEKDCSFYPIYRCFR